MSFSEKVKCHLSKYKKDKFPNVEHGVWKGNGQQYPHILPEHLSSLNFLDLYRKELELFVIDNAIKPHKDIHHLNSSQAMCLNFFYPLLKAQYLDRVTEHLGLKNETIVYESVCFEKNGIELRYGKWRPTNFDFYFETESGKKLYFEIKYTESEFGKGTFNPDKFEKVYSKLLNPINTKFHTGKAFFCDYQILRNLIHIEDKNSHVFFLYPGDNAGIGKGVHRVKSELLNPNFHGQFHAVTWEDLFADVSASLQDLSLKQHMGDFREKYFCE